MDRTVSTSAPRLSSNTLLICFSHLRWDFVYQRPQHLMTRAAHDYEVIYLEESVFENTTAPFLRHKIIAPKLRVVTPILPTGTEPDRVDLIQAALLKDLISKIDYDLLVTWYYTPMALRFSDFLHGDICVYDCMDELSAFKNAPTEITRFEKVLFARADVVFTGGQSLYEAKRGQHHFIHAFPSSIDTAHFQQARRTQKDPCDQSAIPRPRVGYFGVIDERLDADLLARTAMTMSDVQFVVIGPVVKIDPGSLPEFPNIHWLGPKNYQDLPRYMAGWDAGWMPFALNAATRFISPTKTPEFLAAGLQVVSTPIVDVVRTYGHLGLVQIADADTMVEALRAALRRRNAALGKVDAFLSGSSWDSTWSMMQDLLTAAPVARLSAISGEPDYV